MLGKAEIRKRIWEEMERKNIASFPRPVFGRIPNFKGSGKAAENLFTLHEWKKAVVVKVNPDAPQMPVRKKCLEDGKLLVMPTPRIREGFILLDPKIIPKRLYGLASTIKGAFSLGRKIGFRELESLGKIDMIVEGSVAVNKWGERLGKGEGYGELEYAILREIGLVDEDTPIATTVHDIQVLNTRLPQHPWDVPLDIIVTPSRILRAERGPRPKGIIWEVLDKKYLDSIPLLRELAGMKK